jgi:hypothetical protein
MSGKEISQDLWPGEWQCWDEIADAANQASC